MGIDKNNLLYKLLINRVVFSSYRNYCKADSNLKIDHIFVMVYIFEQSESFLRVGTRFDPIALQAENPNLINKHTYLRFLYELTKMGYLERKQQSIYVITAKGSKLYQQFKAETMRRLNQHLKPAEDCE